MDNILIQSFGRRLGKKMRESRSTHLVELLPLYAVNQEELTGKEVIFEIGFGDGQRIAKEALANKNKLFIGAEPFLNGVGTLLKTMKQEKIENIRIYPEDGRVLLENFNDHTLSKIYILFPDPWPKAKHHKRRIINHELLSLLKQKLIKNGEVIIATDHAEYANYIDDHLKEYKLLSREKPKEWYKTKYQEKAENLGLTIKFFCLKFE